jgi:hypothetical protein
MICAARFVVEVMVKIIIPFAILFNFPDAYLPDVLNFFYYSLKLNITECLAGGVARLTLNLNRSWF